MEAADITISKGKKAKAGQKLIYRAITSLESEVRLLRDLITFNLPGDVYDRTLEEVERILIEQTLDKTRGNRATAKRLGISERTLYRKLKKYGLT